MPGGITGLQSGLFAEAWVMLSSHTWGTRSKTGMAKWIRELQQCEKRRVVAVMEVLMTSSSRASWVPAARAWLDGQRTCAKTCPYL